jgi:hypothetical protein
MARQAPFTCLLWAQSRESNDFGCIPAGVNVGLSWAVAGLAPLPLRAFVFVRLGSPMRPVIIASGLRLVARFARIRANVQRRIRWLQDWIRILLLLVSQQRAWYEQYGQAEHYICDPIELGQNFLPLRDCDSG